ncbi:uncharacterized protein METZ01_LOCUS430668, partial [marine metagenome]
PVTEPAEGQVLKAHGGVGSKYALFWAADNSTEAGAIDGNIIGDNAGNQDVTLMFDGTTGDQTLSWADDTQILSFSEPIRLPVMKPLYFSTTGNKILSHSADYDLGIISAGVLKVDAVGDMLIESDGNIKLYIDKSDNASPFVFGIYQETGEIAQFDESGNLQIDGQLQIGEGSFMTATTNSVTFANGATIVNNSADLVTITEATTALSGALTLGTDLAVAHGGTGASTLTDGGVLLGSGTSAITAMAVLADGEMLVGDGATDPVIE